MVGYVQMVKGIQEGAFELMLEVLKRACFEKSYDATNKISCGHRYLSAQPCLIKYLYDPVRGIFINLRY